MNSNGHIAKDTEKAVVPFRNLTTDVAKVTSRLVSCLVPNLNMISRDNMNIRGVK